MPSRLELSKPAVQKHFASLSAGLFKPAELQGIFVAKRAEWRLPKGLSKAAFIGHLVEQTILRR
jgi:hypothetical protein